VIEVSVQEKVQEEKEINLHAKVQKISEGNVWYYSAMIDIDGVKQKLSVFPFKDTDLYFAHSILTDALKKLIMIALSKNEKASTEYFYEALEDLGFAIAYLLAYTISEDIE
jgi:hypothetical protein